jgi:hypothetical protein
MIHIVVLGMSTDGAFILVGPCIQLNNLKLEAQPPLGLIFDDLQYL